MKLRFLRGRFQGRVVDVPETGMSIGRSGDNDLVLDDDGVSRHHCRIVFSGGRWLVEDLNSTNGVRVNGRQITGSVEIHSGDRLGISNLVLLFSSDDAIADAPAAPPETRSPSAETSRRAVVPERSGPDAKSDRREADGKEESSSVPARPERTAPFPWVRAGIAAALTFGGLGLLIQSLRAPSPAGGADASVTPTSAAVESAVAGDAGSPEQTTGEKAARAPSPSAAPLLAAPTAPLPPVAPEDLAPVTSGAGSARGPETGTVAAPNPAAPFLVESRPPGATVYLDEKAVGRTPCVVRGVRSGLHRLRLSLDGYEDEVLQIEPPGMVPSAPFLLRQKPGTVRLESVPSGAAVCKGSQVLGRTPLVLDGLPPGRINLRFVLYGYAPKVLAVDVSEDHAISRRVTLDSMLGGLAVATTPPGCRVLVDGDYKGRTQPAAPGESCSPEFLVDGLPEGPHQLTVEHPVGGRKELSVTVRAGGRTHSTVVFWVPDVEVTLADGRRVPGMLLRRTPDGGLEIATGDRTSVRIAANQVRGLRRLTSEDQAALLKQTAGGTGRPPTAHAATRGDTTDGAGAVDSRRNEAPSGLPIFTVEAVRELIRQSSGIEIDRRFRGKSIRLRGVPTGHGTIRGSPYVRFGREIRCVLQTRGGDAVLNTLLQARARHQEVTVQGTVAEFRGGIFLIEDCRLVETGSQTAQRDRQRQR